MKLDRLYNFCSYKVNKNIFSLILINNKLVWITKLDIDYLRVRTNIITTLDINIITLLILWTFCDNKQIRIIFFIL